MTAHRETLNHFVTLWGLWGEGLSGRKGKSQMTQGLSSPHTHLPRTEAPFGVRLHILLEFSRALFILLPEFLENRNQMGLTGAGSQGWDAGPPGPLVCTISCLR